MFGWSTPVEHTWASSYHVHIEREVLVLLGFVGAYTLSLK
jgi:hypothetical protein